MEFELNKCRSCGSEAEQPDWGCLQEWTKSEAGGFSEVSIICSNQYCDMAISIYKPDKRELKGKTFEEACALAWNSL